MEGKIVAAYVMLIDAGPGIDQANEFAGICEHDERGRQMIEHVYGRFTCISRLSPLSQGANGPSNIKK